MYKRQLLLLFKAKRLHGNNLCFLLKYAADRYAGKIAITDGIYQVNFKKLYKDVLNLSAVIHHKINLEGDSVAILVCGNSINHIITKYAIQNLGIKIILVNQKAHINEIIRTVSYTHLDPDKLTETLKNNNDLQCIVGKDFIPFGKGQSPSVSEYADGVDTLRFLKNL